MTPWAQWFINNNLRYLLYVVAALLCPFYTTVYLGREVFPTIGNELARDFRSIASAKKTPK